MTFSTSEYRTELATQVLSGMEPKRASFYAGIENLADPSQLTENAGKVGAKVRIDPGTAQYLWKFSRYRGSSITEWEQQLKRSIGMELILTDFLCKLPLSELRFLIDPASQARLIERASSPEGTLLLAFHGGFRSLLLKLYEDVFPNGVVVRAGGLSENCIKGRVLAQGDAAATLFLTMRSLAGGNQAFIAPDGPFGKQKSSVSVLGVECPIGDGASFLAFETGCSTIWYTLGAKSKGFEVISDLGPKREKKETFREFRERLHSFYQEKIILTMTGPPENGAPGGRWLQYIRNAAAMELTNQ